MNENQKTFLNELAALFDKYSIDAMYINSGGMISFDSNEESFHFNEYDNGCFRGIVTNPGDYTPKQEG